MKIQELNFDKAYNIPLLSDKPPLQQVIPFPELKILENVVEVAKGEEILGYVYDSNKYNLLKKVKNRQKNHIIFYDQGNLQIVIPNKWRELDFLYIDYKDIAESPKTQKVLEKEIENSFKALEAQLLFLVEKGAKRYLYMVDFDDKNRRFYEIDVLSKKQALKLKSKRWASYEWNSNTKITVLHLKDQVKFVEGLEEIPEEGMGSLLVEDYEATKFMKMWEELKQTEKEYLEESLKDLQPIKYQHFKNLQGNIYEFYIEASHIEDAIKWTKAIGYTVTTPSKGKHFTIGDLKKINEDSIEIEIDEKNIYTFEMGLATNKLPQRGGLLQLHNRGQEVINRRREKAFLRLKQNQTELMELQKILSCEEYQFKDYYLKYRFDGFLKKTLEAQASQRRAIEGAINIPDIFLIQGPPGTGKTTVIKKIISEIKKNDSSAKILISAFQNNAVDNVVEDMGSELVYRFSGNHQSSLQYVNNFTNEILSHLETLIAQDEEKQKELLKDQIKGNFHSLINDHTLLLEEAIQHLKGIIEDYHSLINCQDINIKLMEDLIISCQLQLNTPPQKEAIAKSPILFKEDFLQVLKTFPTSIDAYLEVPEVVEEARYLMEEIIRNTDSNNEVAKNIIEKYQEAMSLEQLLYVETDELFINTKEELQNFYQEIFQQQESLQEEPRDDERKGRSLKLTEEQRENINQIKMNIIKSLNILEGHPNVEIVNRWRNNLINNKSKFQEVLKKFSDVHATTCQKVFHYEFSNFRENDHFDYVIIDEAARANPLDLIIPLVMGRRIILVGDQKQLPHIIDEGVKKKFLEKESITLEEYNNYIKSSLFSRLYDFLPENRKVMLNIQYRMNEEIGRVVSGLFYNHQLETGTTIVNDTPLFTGKSLVAIDVKGKNQEEKEINRQEGEKILQLLQQLEEKGNYDVGVITFYKKQALYLEKVVREAGFQNIRPMIDTVDAFQGKENDIIILSTVRKQGIGFTDDPNRLNVSLSRAKKLLVIVSNIENMRQSESFNYIFNQCHIEE